MCSQRDRTLPEVGRNLRSNSRPRSTVPTIASSDTTAGPRRSLADEPERVDDLLVGQDHADVVGLSAQASGELGQRGPPPCAQEVVLRVDAGHPGRAPLA